jgi:Flp pilus assembly protein TadG
MRFKRTEEGAAAVEFAIIVPVLVLLLFGIIDFGFLFNDYISVRQGAREGARLAVVDNQTPTANCPAGDLVCKTRERVGAPLYWDEIDVAIKFEGDRTPGTDVSVCVDYPMDSKTGLFSAVLDGTLSTKVTMRLETTPSYSEVNPTSCL